MYLSSASCLDVFIYCVSPCFAVSFGGADLVTPSERMSLDNRHVMEWNLSDVQDLFKERGLGEYSEQALNPEPKPQTLTPKPLPLNP